MRSRLARVLLAVLVGPALGPVAAAQATSTFPQFESPQTHPLRLTPQGNRLLAVNTADARLSVFNLSEPSLPVLVAEIPVGIEPVSVAAVHEGEAWVVDHVSDRISVVSLAKQRVVATLRAPDEPCDVVFVGNPPRAFVSCSRSNTVRVFDVENRAEIAVMELQGESPRALAVSSDGASIYVAFALSGNRTTAISASVAPEPPPPTNPKLPSPPQVGLIVDAKDPEWTIEKPEVIWDVLDHDVAEISVASLEVIRYFGGLGTVNLGLAVHPMTGDLYVANTEARNLIQFEPALRGHFADNRLTRVATSGAGAGPTLSIFDLNPGIDYGLLPNPSALTTSLAQPTDLAFRSDGQLYVAAFGSDRVARLDAAGNVLARIEIHPDGPGVVSARTKRGPRGLALNEAHGLLYVQNRISDTISVVDISTDSVLTEIPLASVDPTPTTVREGRGFLYDARLSGNGSASCATCHVDGEDDRLAWDLGDPGGVMSTVVDPLLGIEIVVHPMKGPMVTQTLAGLFGEEPYHWRGDRADLADFNGAFDSLMGGAPLGPDELQTFADFIDTIRREPNPNLRLDRSFPAILEGGAPSSGLLDFQDPLLSGPVAGACSDCHGLPNEGFPFVLQQGPVFQPMNVPNLANFYRKHRFDNKPGSQNVVGFGLEHGGTLAGPPQDPSANDLFSFLLCFDGETAPGVGYSRTLDDQTAFTSDFLDDLLLLEKRVVAGDIDLIAKGTLDGQPRGLQYDSASGVYRSDKPGDDPLSLTELQQHAADDGALLTFMGVPPGAGMRMGVDRDADGVLDGQEIPPTFLPYGTGCTGVTGIPPRLNGIGLVSAGAAFQLRIDLAFGGATALLFAGTSGGPVFVEPGCFLQVGSAPVFLGALPLAGVGATGGEVSFVTQLPPEFGPPIQARLQAVIIEPSGLAVTNPIGLILE